MRFSAVLICTLTLLTVLPSKCQDVSPNGKPPKKTKANLEPTKPNKKFPKTLLQVKKSDSDVPKTLLFVKKLDSDVSKTTLPVKKSDSEAPKTLFPDKKSDSDVQKSSFPVNKSDLDVTKTILPVKKSDFDVPKTALPVKKSDSDVQKNETTTGAVNATSITVAEVSNSTKETSGCACAPMCESIGNCASNRTSTRHDCSCCDVCLSLENGECSANDSTKPCDEDFGLACKTGICQYQVQVKVLTVTNSSVIFRAKTEEKITVSFSDFFDGNKTTWTTSESKQKKSTEDFMINNLKPDTKYFIKVQTPESFRIITSRTLSTEVETKTLSPQGRSNDLQILVTKLTPSSISIAWDDFKIPSSNDYVVEYKLSRNNSDEKNWTNIKAGNIALATISNLIPNSNYTVRVTTSNAPAIKDAIGEGLSINIQTKDGCVSNNSTYMPEEKFDDGCEKRCVCSGDNKLKCSPICEGPHFRVSSFKNDPYCFEKPVPDEPCCALVTCAGNGGDFFELEPKQAITIAENETLTEENSDELGGCDFTFCGPNAVCVAHDAPKCVCLPGFSGNPNELDLGCQKRIEEAKPKPGYCSKTVLSLGESCVSTCKKDRDCPAVMKCCPTSCGSYRCSSPRLKQGTVPANATGRSSSKCIFNKEPYSIGDEFFDGCEFKCKCNPTSEVTCGPRCSDQVSEDTRKDPQCTVEQNPNDPCCEIAVCSIKSVSPKNVTNNASEPTKKPPKGSKLPVFDGCIYKNKTHQIGDIFYDACISRCECGGYGKISCLPRCPLVHSPGPHCMLQPDPDDLCCKIPVCNISNIKSHKVKDLKLILESINARNASVVRLIFTASNLTSLTNDTIQVWHMKASELESKLWEKIDSNIYQLKDAKAMRFYTDINSLEPQTTYYFRLALFESKLDTTNPEFSNTASIKTFPRFIQRVFNGCFRGNATYEAGEDFFDGCEYKCRCHAGGGIKCEDRCQKFKNTIGYEHCAWQPAPDDDCCIIPICSNNPPDPSLDPNSPGLLSPDDNKQHQLESPDKIEDTKLKCVYDNKEYPLKSTWEIGSGCLRGVCICVQNHDGSPKIDCVGGCPHLSEQLISTPQCPNPRIVPANEPCVCAVVSCNKIDSSLAKPMCSYRDKKYNVGEEFYDGCDGVCMCMTSLKVHCQPLRCPRQPQISGCVKWDIPETFIAKAPNCCPPPPVCINDGSCMYEGIKYRNFEKLPRDPKNCGIECRCQNGEVSCVRKCAAPPKSPPLSLGCSPNGAVIRPTQVDTDMCCMMWTCRRKPIIKKSFKDLKVIPLNSTAIRFLFVIPQTFVGHRGHAEISYTYNPSLNVDDWSKKQFSRPHSVFDTTHIQYHLSNLEPNVMYFVKLAVVSHETKEIIQSNIIRVRTLPAQTNSQLRARPQLPPPVYPSDRLPPTRHLPPQSVQLDMKIESKILSSSSVRITWRSFDGHEREVISGVKVVATDQNGVEEISPLLHQAVQMYELIDLIPKASYKVNLQVVPHDGEPINFDSINPVTVQMPKDEYEMIIKLKPSKVSADGVKISLKGVPTPVEKYVNVMQVMYQNGDDVKPSSFFYDVKNNAEPFEIKNLKPGHNYKVWAKLYLKNGNSMTLDTLTVDTLPSSSVTQYGSKDLLKTEASTKSKSNSYYTAFVVVCIIAVIIIMAFIIVLYMLVKKKSNDKALINRSETAYNNPTFKSGGEGDNYAETPHQNGDSKLSN